MTIEVKNANLTLGNKVLLDGLSVSFASGELTMILGPNGSGKSSLLRVINGELASQTEVAFYAKPRRQWSAPELAKSVATLPQTSRLNFNFTAQEVVELGGLLLTATGAQLRQFAHDNMQKTGVAALANHYYPSLSGGEKQRVHLARVLTQVQQSPRPVTIMLDEPTSALDIAHQHQVLALLRSLARQGACIITVIHDLNLAAQYADRLLLLNNGRIVADGDGFEVLTPANIAAVYQHTVHILPHPEHGFPMVIT